MFTTHAKKLRTEKGMVNFNGGKKRILLIENEEEAQELAALTLADYKLICARDINDGLIAARRGYFDLYILDNWLPSGSGVEMCRVIRKFDPHTPILFYSGAAYEDDIQDALRAGAQDYLVKPVIPNELRQAVSLLISAACETAFEARRAEVAAILEELAIRKMENTERLEKAKQKRLRAEEKALRDKAQLAFLAAGGTRGDFAREWPSVLLEEVRGARALDLVRG
jgi:DNA-binding response OmpR family regulator